MQLLTFVTATIALGMLSLGATASPVVDPAPAPSLVNGWDKFDSYAACAVWYKDCAWMPTFGKWIGL